MHQYKNIVDCVKKFPKINGSELAYKIICAQRIICKERQDFIESKIMENNKKIAFGIK